jgi:glucose-6-phosphate 1-epimerase
MKPMNLVAPDGARVQIQSIGAQVASWIPAGGRERFFTAANAPVGTAAFKGGIPVCFPQFASQGPLPAHGFARDLPWTPGERGIIGDDAWTTFKLSQAGDLATRWPHRFELTLKVIVGGARLVTELSVHNPAARAWYFTGALHTYFLVDDIDRVRVGGLAGLEYIDKTLANARARQGDEPLRVTAETDRVYLGAQRPVTLQDGAGTLEITTRGFPDVVIWNPWEKAELKFPQLGPGDYRRFICIEAAVAGNPVSLEEGQGWTGSQQIIVRP